MEKILSVSFGYLIAFILPGFVVVLSLTPYSQLLQNWLKVTYSASPNVSAFICVIFLSLIVGITISAIRWLIFDHIIFRKLTNRIAELDYSKLSLQIERFKYINEGHYQFYQFYANMFISMFTAYLFFCLVGIVYLFIFVAIEILLLYASADCLKKFCSKAEDLANNKIIINPKETK